MWEQKGNVLTLPSLPPSLHSHPRSLPRRTPARRPASAPRAASDKLSGIVFEPFAEVKTELAAVESKSKAGAESLARTGFAADCEAALNEQIK